jgi:glycolate oxidase FAD binding subunit
MATRALAAARRAGRLVSTAPSVIAPASTAEVRDAVCDARTDATSLRIVAQGRWLDAGRPVRAAQHLSLAALTGITEYTPGDLTLTALAATPLAEIARVTSAERQWLTLDPAGSPCGSLGATVATGSCGALAHAFGAPRDNVLGLEAVAGTGAVIHAGGRVVKNVAGFDLTRLFTGSWGTLGVITQVTVRLRALPEVDASFAMPVDDRRDALSTLISHLGTTALAPLALELVNAALARRLGVAADSCLLVRLGGNADAVRAQQDTLQRIGELVSVPGDVWGRLRECEPAMEAVVRFSTLPSRIGNAWSVACAASANAPGALVHASPERGVVRCIVPYDEPAELDPLLARARTAAFTRIVERVPASEWTSTLAPSAVSDRLSLGIKRSYDPMNILNPGLLGGDE